jgi:curli production assembly/transport component CsgF
MDMRFAVAFIVVAMSVAGLATSGMASQLTYAPVNPTFGGNPLNGTYLLSVGQSQGYGLAQKNQANNPDLTGLDNALSNLGTNLNTGTSTPIIVIPSTPTNP